MTPAPYSRKSGPLKGGLLILFFAIWTAPLAADFEDLTGTEDDAATVEKAAVKVEAATKNAAGEAAAEVKEAVEEIVKEALPVTAEPQQPDQLEFDASGATIHYSPGLQPEISRIGDLIKRGLATIQSELESPGLPRTPHFWLVSNDTELALILKKQYPEMSGAVLQSALAGRMYMKADAYFLVYKPGIARQRLIRLIYNEFALLHLSVLAAGGPDKRIAWFHSGMAAYLAWITEAELNKTGIQDVEKKMIQYYGRNFDPAKARSLKELEDPARWAAAIRTDYKGVYAQAALAWMYLVRRSSLTSGPLILRNMSTGESFADSFANATDLRLGQFERDLREKFYPEIQAARKATVASELKAKEERKAGSKQVETKAVVPEDSAETKESAAKPAESDSSEKKPAESDSSEKQPAEKESSKEQPVESDSSEKQPAEKKSSEESPAETKSPEAEPAS